MVNLTAKISTPDITDIKECVETNAVCKELGLIQKRSSLYSLWQETQGVTVI